MHEIVEERAERAVDVGPLAAARSMRADERGATVEAGAFVGVTVGALAGRGLHGPCQQASFDQAADRFDPSRHAPSLPPGATKVEKINPGN